MLAIQKHSDLPLQRLIPKYRRLILPVVLSVLLFNPATQQLALTVLSDAFWQVSVFVAFTLAIYHLFADKLVQFSASSNTKYASLKELCFASLMGCLPGCGGAIIVITQFVKGATSFGAVVAVLTSTMGDAAFLLLVSEPDTGLAVIILCFIVGIISGVCINFFHDANFMRSNKSVNNPACCQQQTNSKPAPKRLLWQAKLWQILLVPCAVIGLAMAAQIDVATIIGITESNLKTLGAIITLSFIFLWATTREVNNFESIVAEDRKEQQNKALQKVALDTNFVTSWVVVAFLSFELFMFYSELNIAELFQTLGNFAPLAGVLVGMIPGCGPQIITTSLYLAGAVPLSSQIGNAISNDGDALFPAIALHPKVALVATLYSSIPAIITAYGYFYLFE